MPALKNAKRERFCLEYVKDFNGARAARDAGYTKNSFRFLTLRIGSRN